MIYEIIATLGPASQDVETWAAMLGAGATGFRLNTSHLSLSELDPWLDRLGKFISTLAPAPSLVLDLQGSKWRLGNFDPFELVEGQRVGLVCADSSGRSGVLPVPHTDFFQAACLSGEEIALNDARSRLAVEACGPDWMHARVLLGGEIAPRKGITFETTGYRKESLNEKDQAILKRVDGLRYVRCAISYVKDAVEMKRYREAAGPHAALVAKLERRSAVEEAAQIAGVAGELWLCRGDLGAELGLRDMAAAAYRFSEQVSSLPVPSLLAGQVLEHMTAHPTPTRSEVAGLYAALAKGYRGFVLSDETAIGRDSVESCRIAALFKGFHD